MMLDWDLALICIDNLVASIMPRSLSTQGGDSMGLIESAILQCIDFARIVSEDVLCLLQPIRERLFI